MRKEGFNLNFDTNSVTLTRQGAHQISVPLISQEDEKFDLAKTTSSQIIPPHSESLLSLKTTKFRDGEIVLCEPPRHLAKNELAGGKCLSVVKSGKVWYRLMNPTALPVFLKAKTRVSVLSSIGNTDIINVTDNENPDDLLNSEAINSLYADSTTNEQYIEIAKELGINLENSDLTSEQKQKLLAFIGKNRKSFAKDFSELGVTNLQSHRIETGDHKPFKKAPYRQSPDMRRETERQVKEMLDNGIIQESDSPWASPVVLVKKKNGEWRFAVDYRELNKITTPMFFPIPHVSDVFDTIADAKAEIFSVLDLKSGFWQVPLDPETAHKSAFVTHQSVYSWTRLPFGMMNSSFSFQCLMNKVLKNLNWKIALVYIDDILVFSKNFEEHLDHLSQVFSNLKAANLTLQPSKCQFATKEIDYLGHIISKNGIKVNPEKTKAIDEYPRPKNVKQVKSFLGMASYYRKFIKSYAKIASPLTALLKKDTKFNWSQECEDSFNTLKNSLTSAPILAFPNFEKPFVLATDSSDYSIGYVLSQLDQEGLEHPIAFGGRALHGHELKWHITDKEGLALVEAVSHFRPYLANNFFTVYTDNVSVKWLKQIKNCQGRLGRWALALQGYNFEIAHKASSANGNADGLSRRVYDHIKDEESCGTPSSDSGVAASCQVVDGQSQELAAVTLVYSHEEQSIPSVAPVTASTETAPNNKDSDPLNSLHESLKEDKDFITFQRQDENYRDIVQYKLNKKLPDDLEKAKLIVAEAQQYEFSEYGILLHLYTPRTKGIPKNEKLISQVCIPSILRDDILKAYHDSLAGGMHQGFERTYAAIRLKYYWPSMFGDCQKYIKTCEECQRVKRDVHGKSPPLQPMPVVDVFQRWHIDILGGLPTTRDKYKYVLLVVDSYSKWSEAFPMRTQEATEVAAILFKEVICRYGAPNVLVSDRGQQFLSKLVKALCELFQITRFYTSSYRPLLNGAVERMNSVILQSLRLYCKGQQDDWPDLLPSIMMAYRMTPSTQSTQHSPFFLLFGREMRLPIDTSLTPKSTLSSAFKTHLSQVIQSLELARKIATENIKIAQDKYKTQYDKKCQEQKYKPADRVWLYCTKVPPGKAPKLHRKWVGPYYIVLTGPHNTFKLRRCSDNKEVKVLVNATRLKPYFDPEDRPTNPPSGYEHLQEPLNSEEMPDYNQHQNTQTNQNETAHQNSQQGQNVANPPNKGKGPKNPKIQAKVKKSNKSKTHSNTTNNEQNSANKDSPIPNTSSQSKLPDQSLNEPSNSSNSDDMLVFDQTTPDHSNSLSNHSKNEQSTSLKEPDQSTKPTNSDKFSTFEIDKILAAKRSGDILYYKIKWKNPSKASTWEYATTIPEVFAREYHVHKTMAGKRRKRPLQNHRFFEKSTSKIRDNSKPDKNKVMLMGYRETYDLSNQSIIKWFANRKCTAGMPFPISERKKQCQPYLNVLFDCLKQCDYDDWHSTTALLDNGQTVQARMVREVTTENEDDPFNSTYFKVYIVGSRQPVWLPFLQAPLKFVRQFLFRFAAKIKQKGKIFKANYKFSPTSDYPTKCVY